MTGQVCFEDAVSLHRQRRLQEAERVYRQVLQNEPTHPGALHMLGVARHQQGDHAEAIELIGQAIALGPPSAVYLNNYGLALHALGRTAEALDCFRRALEIRPQYAQGLANLGMVHEAMGDTEEALAGYCEALRIEPYHPDAVTKLAALLEKLGRVEEAIGLYQDGTRRVPATLEFHVNLGAVLIAAGRPEEAVGPLQTATGLAPDCVAAHLNLGMAHVALGQYGKALSCLRKAVELQPRNPDALARLAAVLQTLGKTEEAARSWECLVSVRPDDAEAHFNLGSALEELQRTEEARGHFQRAAELRPDRPLWRLRAAVCCPAVFGCNEEIDEWRGRVERVLDEWRRTGLEPVIRDGLKTRPTTGDGLKTRPTMKDRLETCATIQDGLETRPTMKDRLKTYATMKDRSMKDRLQTCPTIQDRLATCPTTGDGLENPSYVGNLSYEGDEILGAGVIPAFALSFQGRNNRELKRKFAALYEPYFRDQPQPPGSGCHGRPRVGFVVTNRHEGIFLRFMRGIVEKLDPERFEPVVLCSLRNLGRLREGLRRDGLKFVPFDDSLPGAIETVRKAACDLMYYWELGTDALNYFLPFARLAPVQCASTLSTSGIPAVDYFYSSGLMETDAADAHYTEKLWRSKTLFSCQPRLSPVPPAAAGDFGLPEGRNLYVCFQNPLKLHPDFDPILAGILAADPKALIVLMADRSGSVAELLNRRFAVRSDGGEDPSRGARGVRCDRIVFLNRQSFSNYCRLIQLANVILDPPHFGAGSSCYDIFSFNQPVVTMPGEFMSGRTAYAFYKKMGIDELIVSSAEEYVEKAVQVATDREYRDYVKRRIATASDVVFDDITAVREHERFFDEVLAARV